MINDGVVEIWLTSEDTGTYGKDINDNIINLLKNITDILPKHVMLRLGMTNPPYILEYVDDISKILNHSNVYSFLHLPVQSGSNKILKKMKREYTREDFIYLVETLTNNVPDIHIVTDIICGFPFENENDFMETVDLIKKYKFITLNISKFCSRKGTPASRFPQIDNNVKKQRTTNITKIDNEYLPYKKYVGKNVVQAKKENYLLFYIKF